MAKDVNDTEITRAELKKWMKQIGFRGNTYGVGDDMDYICLNFKEDAEGFNSVSIEVFFDKMMINYGDDCDGFVLYNDGITLEVVKAMVSTAIKYMEDHMDKKENL